MSETIAEIAAREAEEAERDDEQTEAENDTAGEQAGEDEPGHEARVAEAETAIDMAEREKKLKGEDTRHENALKKIYGDDFANMAFCPCCLGQGFMEPMPDGSMPDDVWLAVQVLTGHDPSGGLTVPDFFLECATCHGYGEVATPGKGNGVRRVPCKRCDARGWFDTDDPVQRGRAGLAPPQLPPPPAPSYAPPAPQIVAANGSTLEPPAEWYATGKPGADPWDRWPGHPRYGIDPAHGGW